jgi:hypothetical protein
VFQAALELPREHPIHATAAALVDASKLPGPILVSLGAGAGVGVRQICVHMSLRICLKDQGKARFSSAV